MTDSARQIAELVQRIERLERLVLAKPVGPVNEEIARVKAAGMDLREYLKQRAKDGRKAGK